MFEFYENLLQHLPIYLAILLATIGAHYRIFRKHVFSVFDPLFYYFVVTEAFCVADVLFMAVYGIIETRYVISYMATEVALFAGFLQFRPVGPPPQPGAPESIPGSLRATFQLCLVMFVGLNLLVYAQRGIPLLMESRLETYAGGGWGIISRLLDILLIVIAFYLMEVLRRGHWRLRHWAVLVVVLTTQVLTGAKSAVLGLVFIGSLHGFLTGDQGGRAAAASRVLKRLAAGALAAFLFIAAFQSTELELANTPVSALGQAALRLVNNGDAFINSYPNGVIEELDGSKPFQAVFREYLGAFRLADPEQLPTHIGVQISRWAFGSDSTTQTNAKHNVFGYVYFGAVGAVVFSFMVGAAVGFVRYRLLSAVPLHWAWAIAYIILNLSFCAAANEWDGASRGVINAIGLFLLLGLGKALGAAQRKAAAARLAPSLP